MQNYSNEFKIPLTNNRLEIHSSAHTRRTVVVVGRGRDELIDDMEADVLDAIVGVESQPQIAAGRLDERRLAASTEAADGRRVAERTVAHLQIVVGAVVRRLDVELAAEIQPYPVTRRRCNNAMSTARAHIDNGIYCRLI